MGSSKRGYRDLKDAPNARHSPRVTTLKKAGVEPLTPLQINHLRGQISAHVEMIIPRAVEVLNGERTWTSVQASLFKTMMAKVVPDLSQTHATVEHVDKELKELSRAELEAIVSSPSLDKGDEPGEESTTCEASESDEGQDEPAHTPG